MSSSSLSALRDDRPMTNTSSTSRTGGPRPRRTFTPAQKLDPIGDYEDTSRPSEVPE